MKNYLLLFTFLTATCLNAQSRLPRAGEILDKDINKTELIKMMRTGIPTADEPLTVINFDSSNASFKGNYPFSTSYALGISPEGDLVFVGSGGGIYVTDISDPQNPVVLSEIRTRSLVDRCTYDPVNKRLYVCAYFSGIEIWDLSDLYHPTRMSRFPTEPYPRSGVAYSGNYLFFTTNYSLWTLDISDPYNPVIVEDLYIANNLILQMYMKGETVYIVTSSQGLKIIDVSDPLNLQLIASYGYASGSEFDISGDYLYAVNSSGVFTILNISDSLNVTVAGNVNIGDYPQDVVVFNNKAYISKAGTGGGLQIVNVEDPSTPTPISLYSGDYEFIAGIEDYVYLTRNSTFSVLDVTDSTNVQYVSGFEIPGFVEDISVSGSYAYTGSNGFRVIDVSDSTHPLQVGYVDIDGSLVEAADNSLVLYCPYSMGASNTVHIMDVSDPANPVSLSSYTSPVMTWDLVVKNNLAFVACWWDGVRILNFENPSNLTLVGHTMGWTSGGIPGVDYCYAQAVDVEGNYLYIVDYGPFSGEDTYGLYIIDISDPSDPNLINRFQNITSHVQDVKVKDDKAYIADGYGGVEVVDVSDPMNPSVIGYVDLIDGSTGITLSGDYAYVSEYILGGLQVVDISDPASPTLVGWYEPSGCFALGVDESNGFVYVADGIAGFQIYRNLLVTPVSVKTEKRMVDNFMLYQNYPNPFNPSTKIKYTVPSVTLRQAQSDIVVTLKVYDILGREIATLVNEEKPAGEYEV
ncbi:MAG: hypothetical protein OQK65_01535, partial [Chlorobium sp.]|nr:hypothetical protein [Chlorobium sp.]